MSSTHSELGDQVPVARQVAGELLARSKHLLPGLRQLLLQALLLLLGLQQLFLQLLQLLLGCHEQGLPSAPLALLRLHRQLWCWVAAEGRQAWIRLQCFADRQAVFGLCRAPALQAWYWPWELGSGYGLCAGGA